jgi:hypothetical protein
VFGVQDVGVVTAVSFVENPRAAEALPLGEKRRRRRRSVMIMYVSHMVFDSVPCEMSRTVPLQPQKASSALAAL